MSMQNTDFTHDSNEIDEEFYSPRIKLRSSNGDDKPRTVVHIWDRCEWLKDCFQKVDRLGGMYLRFERGGKFFTFWSNEPNTRRIVAVALAKLRCASE